MQQGTKPTQSAEPLLYGLFRSSPLGKRKRGRRRYRAVREMIYHSGCDVFSRHVLTKNGVRVRDG